MSTPKRPDSDFPMTKSSQTTPIDFASVDKTAMPRFEVVKQQITREILDGTWAAGTVLPGETAMAQQFGVAVGTVRRALADLVQEGLLSRRRRTGTVVTGRMPKHSMRFFYDYFRLHDKEGKLQRSQPTSLSLERRAASADEAEKLEIPKGSEVIAYHRLRSVADRPIMHEIYLIPSALVPGFPERAEEVPEFLSRALAEDYHQRITAIREAVTAELATDEDARLLKLERPAAILRIVSVNYDQSSHPVLIATHWATTEGQLYINEIF